MTALLTPLLLSTGTAQAAPWNTRLRLAQMALDWAKKELGKPYSYGATGPGSFDCSGLTQFVYRKAGIRIPRTAAEQYHNGHNRISWNKLHLGDLVFFNDLGHVGIVSKVSGGKIWMINAPHTGDHVREVLLDGYRKAGFYGAVRPY